MSLERSFLFCILLTLPCLSFGQKRNTPFQTTKNFLSYRMGIGYPFFSNGSNSGQAGQTYVYEYLSKGVNYSVHAGVGVGHVFGRNFSISLSPYVLFSRYAKTDYHFEEIQNSNNKLRRERIGYFRYSNTGLLFPLEFNFKIKEKLHFSAGVFVYKPFTDRLFDRHIETDYRLNPPKTYSPYTRFYKNRRSEYRSGIHGQFSFLLKERDWRQKRINLEYYHSLTLSDFNAREKWIMVAFKKVLFQ